MHLIEMTASPSQLALLPTFFSAERDGEPADLTSIGKILFSPEGTPKASKESLVGRRSLLIKEI